MFHPRLVNEPFGDPALFIPFFLEKRALLFDMGDLQPLTSREMLKITHAFITHTHMDHFIGFDTLLRLFLGRDRRLHLFGPPFFLKNVEGKLSGYTWNLVKNYTQSLFLVVTEVHPDKTLSQTYHCADGFTPKGKRLEAPFNGTLLRDDTFSIESIHLDHKIPCLAFKLTERFHVNIMKDRLIELGLPVGPWLKAFKQALYQEQSPETPFTAYWQENQKERTRKFRLGDLTQAIALISPGQKIVYIVDAGYSPENAQKIISFAASADQLFIEGAFLDVDKDAARRKHHLTAKQAGTIARKAQAKSLTLMHFSPKYKKTPELLVKEALEAFSCSRHGRTSGKDNGETRFS